MSSPSALLEALPLAALHLKLGISEDQLNLPKAVITDDQRAELDRCRADIVHWINTYVKTYDPRFGPDGKPVGITPFSLYAFQAEYIRWLEERLQRGEDGLTEKSRDMGATWSFLAWVTHHWLFDDVFQALLGSRVEDLVDRAGEWDTLFGKLDIIIEHLPAWMMPPGYNARQHRSHMRLSHPGTGNAIQGQATTPDFARQGRYTVIGLDEFAFSAWGEAVWTGTRDAARSRFPLSTPNGNNHFKRLRDSGHVAVYTLHWHLHPEKTPAWYEAEKARRTAEDIAQELDISYNKSLRGRVYSEWDSVPKGSYPFVRGWPLYVSWDFGLDDNTAMIWWQRNTSSNRWRIVAAYSNSGKTIDFYVPFTTGQMLSGLPYQFSASDIETVNGHATWGPAVHFGDPAGAQRNQVTGTSVIDELRKHGIYIQTKPDVNTFEARFHATKLGLRDIEGVNSAACGSLDDAISNARFPETKETSQRTSEINKPIHDWTSHYRTAIEYFMVNKPDVTRRAPGLSVAARWAS